MNTISLENIKSLKAEQLTELLLKLLHLEYKKYNFQNCYINVPQNITTADGGEDGRITTDDNKDSKWVIDKYCLFQCKATEMAVSECSKEILEKKRKNSDADILKTQVKDVLINNGTYILFIKEAYVESVRNESISQRLKAIRDSIEKAEGKSFAEKAKIKIYDANLIRDWTNEYISAVSFVQLCSGIVKPLGLQIWSELKSHNSNSNDFKTNADIDSLIEKIRTDIFNNLNIRIEGVSGIGKTRLTCEIFSPGEPDGDGNFDLNRKSISESLIYFDVGKGNIQNIFDFIRSTVTTFPAVLVLDNCDPKNHNKFLEEVCRSGSLQTLITIDYEKCNLSNNDTYNLIELKGEMFNSVVEDILKNQYRNSTLSDNDINYLISFSEGNPKMAINFVRAAIHKRDLNQGFDRELLEKLIFGREVINHLDFKVLKLCSVFKYFEYPTEDFYLIDKNNYNLLLEHVRFFSNFLNIDINDVEILLKKYLSKGVLERRGNKIIIRPNPLSLKLSILFWEELNILNYEPFIGSIPKNLITPLADQLSQLGSVNKAKEFVETIWGVNGNFSTAEILNSNMGSRLFRSIVTVNPKATVKVLTKNYLNKPKEYLTSIVEARQNLVWALEKLCFREDTFLESTKVLMSFAAAEIETYYSNNATDYFTQLFRIYLAGTEVGYDPRIEVLKWAIEKEDSDFDALVIKACGRAFTPTYNLHKMGGAEKQGGLLPLEDYYPKNQKEINDYRINIIELLSKFTFHENQFQFSAQKIIYSNINNLFEFHFEMNKLKVVLDGIIKNVVDRDDFIKSLYSQGSFVRINEKQREFINTYVELLKTNTIEEKILYNVSEPKIIIKTIKDEEEYVDRGKRLAEKFAEEVIEKKIDIQPYFRNLLVGNQYNAFDFGKKLSELSEYNKDFIDNLILELQKIENERYNISFFFGYISVLEEARKREIFNILILKKSSFAFNILRFVELDFDNIFNLISLIENKDINSNKLELIKNDVVKLSPYDLKKYFELIKKFENGQLLIIDTFSTLIWVSKNSRVDINQNILNYIKSIVEETNLLILISKNRIIDLYSWEEIMILLIKSFGDKFCAVLSKHIVQYYESLSLYASGDPHIANIANMTLDIDFKNSWNIYSKLILDKNLILFWNVFDMNFISGVGPKHPFFKNEERNNYLLEWLLKNKEFAPWIIRVAPLFDETGNDWFYYTESLINIFGEDDNFINELSANLHSMTTWGSRVPFLAARLKLVEQLQNHKLEKVKEWVKNEIEHYEKVIKIEEIRDDEGFLGM
ncbi:ligand-binding sensor domain-containing protein [Confluentibacter flavum]|uniref:Uncharacterized protein n=1 Tax=Confluentibacter flavum TaxID=1909700 RepID=A0A2N3HHN2_9FLAO|nr:hypothetical protein [Confluentibacter flavum]PKQ44466.1 hypothetical protein CSW08_13745 [Confluentibacter flavum]